MSDIERDDDVDLSKTSKAAKSSRLTPDSASHLEEPQPSTSRSSKFLFRGPHNTCTRATFNQRTYFRKQCVCKKNPLFFPGSKFKVQSPPSSAKYLYSIFRGKIIKRYSNSRHWKPLSNALPCESVALPLSLIFKVFYQLCKIPWLFPNSVLAPLYIWSQLIKWPMDILTRISK